MFSLEQREHSTHLECDMRDEGDMQIIVFTNSKVEDYMFAP